MDYCHTVERIKSNGDGLYGSACNNDMLLGVSQSHPVNQVYVTTVTNSGEIIACQAVYSSM